MTGPFRRPRVEGLFSGEDIRAWDTLWGGGSANIVVDAKSTPAGFEVRVHDSGRGIPSGIRDSLFDPFVSSGKPNGTGLGLAIVSKIVQDHSGTVSIEQTSESGTTVLVRLPAAELNVPASATSTIH